MSSPNGSDGSGDVGGGVGGGVCADSRPGTLVLCVDADSDSDRGDMATRLGVRVGAASLSVLGEG